MGLENFNGNQQETRSMEELKKMAVDFLYDDLDKSRFIARNEQERVLFENIYDELKSNFFNKTDESVEVHNAMSR